MRNTFRILAFVAGLAASELAMAQPIPGWDVAWGPAAVPISPWANALIGLSLVIAAYAFLRKRVGTGLMTLAGVALVTGLVLHADNVARALPIPTYTITSPSGSHAFSCAPADLAVGAGTMSAPTFVIGTSVAGGITLTVTPNGPWPTPYGECLNGRHLSPGDTCTLTCPAVI